MKIASQAKTREDALEHVKILINARLSALKERAFMDSTKKEANLRDARIDALEGILKDINHITFEKD